MTFASRLWTLRNHLNSLKSAPVLLVLTDMPHRKSIVVCTVCWHTISFITHDLGIGWGFSVDIFALGCILYELEFRCRFVPIMPAVNVFFAFLESTMGPFKPEFVKEIRECRPLLFNDDPKTPNVILDDNEVNFVLSHSQRISGNFVSGIRSKGIISCITELSDTPRLERKSEYQGFDKEMPPARSQGSPHSGPVHITPILQ